MSRTPQAQSAIDVSMDIGNSNSNMYALLRTSIVLQHASDASLQHSTLGLTAIIA
jgi:hypothetical protein